MPLPEYLVSVARPHPTRFTQRFDNKNQWTFYKLDAGGRSSLSVLCCACFLLPVLAITLWLLTWCPDESDSLDASTSEHLLVGCGPGQVNNTVNSTQNCVIVSAYDLKHGGEEESCCNVTRVVVLASFVLLLGFPGIFCLVSALAPLIDHIYYYYRPLGRQLYVNYPEVFDGFGSVDHEAETRFVNHLRALTLLYTVDRLSRLPSPNYKWSCVGRFLWQCRSMYHFQWARSHREWVLRVAVYPDGSVLCRIDDRDIGAAELFCDQLYRMLARLGRSCGCA